MGSKWDFGVILLLYELYTTEVMTDSTAGSKIIDSDLWLTGLSNVFSVATSLVECSHVTKG